MNPQIRLNISKLSQDEQLGMASLWVKAGYKVWIENRDVEAGNGIVSKEPYICIEDQGE